jgi:hypothetical protein
MFPGFIPWKQGYSGNRITTKSHLVSIPSTHHAPVCFQCFHTLKIFLTFPLAYFLAVDTLGWGSFYYLTLT